MEKMEGERDTQTTINSIITSYHKNYANEFIIFLFLFLLLIPLLSCFTSFHFFFAQEKEKRIESGSKGIKKHAKAA